MNDRFSCLCCVALLLGACSDSREETPQHPANGEQDIDTVYRTATCDELLALLQRTLGPVQVCSRLDVREGEGGARYACNESISILTYRNDGDVEVRERGWDQLLGKLMVCGEASDADDEQGSNGLLFVWSAYRPLEGFD